jgi:hypothetical protein
MSDTCATCRYWDPIPNLDRDGFCRRRAPVLADGRTTYPKITHEGWCGDGR